MGKVRIKVHTAMLAALLLVAMSFVADAATPSNPKCFGETATHRGTNQPNTMNGTSGDDVMTGLEGGDTINGKGGDDYLCGHGKPDELSGGPGNDKLNGNEGNDTLNGDDGNDLLDGGPRNDVVKGGPGADIVKGGRGDDNLNGGGGNNGLKGGGGVDKCVNGELLNKSCEANLRVVGGDDEEATVDFKEAAPPVDATLANLGPTDATGVTVVIDAVTDPHPPDHPYPNEAVFTKGASKAEYCDKNTNGTAGDSEDDFFECEVGRVNVGDTVTFEAVWLVFSGGTDTPVETVTVSFESSSARLNDHVPANDTGTVEIEVHQVK